MQVHDGCSDVLTSAEIADRIGVPRSTVEQWRRLGVGPPAVKVAGGWLYRRRVVATWLRAGAPSFDAIPSDVAHRMADQLRVAVIIDAPLKGLPSELRGHVQHSVS